MDWLSALSNVASIATAAVAVWAFFKFRNKRRGHTRELEAYLRSKMDTPYSSANLPECSAYLGITEKEVLEAAAASPAILRSATCAVIGAPPIVILEYDAALEADQATGGLLPTGPAHSRSV